MNARLAILALLVLAGCASMQAAMAPPQFKQKVDAYDGSVTSYEGALATYACAGRVTTVAEARTAPTVNFGFASIRNKGGPPQYSIVVDYYADAWLFIKAGASLEVLIDGRPASFSSVLGSSHARHVTSDVTVLDSESAMYDASRADIEKLATAARLQFRLTGSNGQVEACVLEKQLPSIGEFLAKTR
jgi:hypothetical protein